MYDLGTNIGVFNRYGTETKAKLRLTTYCRVYSIVSETKKNEKCTSHSAEGKYMANNNIRHKFSLK